MLDADNIEILNGMYAIGNRKRDESIHILLKVMNISLLDYFKHKKLKTSEQIKFAINICEQPFTAEDIREIVSNKSIGTIYGYLKQWVDNGKIKRNGKSYYMTNQYKTTHKGI
ncbi:MAG: hypothetical protein GY845_25870 [Planctomycetes bacterium]|nr:hypothetical protein [Planctomycetota bacterium]